MRQVYHAIQPYQPKRYKCFPPAKPGHKYCIDCEQEKLLTNFHQMQGTSDGRRPTCKECRKKHDLLPAIPVQMPLFILSKVCTKCGKPKELDEFDADPDGKCGRGSQCKQCRSDYNCEFRQENLEYFQEYEHSRDKTKRNENWNRRYREAYSLDPDYVAQKRAIRKAWYQANPLKTRNYVLNRIARKRQVTVGKVSLKHILARDGFWCYICEQPILPHQKLDFDHVIPLQPRPGKPQGMHCEDNIKPTHKVCNIRKSNKQFEDLTPFERRGPDCTIYE